MKFRFPDTVFARLFGVTLAAVMVSHLVTAALLLVFADRPLPPPPPPSGLSPPEWRQAMPPPGAPGGGPRRGLPPMFWLGMAVQFVAVVGAAWAGARLMARPLQDLAGAASRLGENLNAPPIVETGPIEAREAARGFNRMQERIRLQIDERGRFLAAVSHDLRTPLTRIKLRIERVADEAARDRLRADVAEMTAMLDATLEYLRGNSRREAWQWLDAQALVEALIEDARENGDIATVAGRVGPILAQPGALRRCLGNLIDNAVRYGGRADIVLSETADSLVIEIHDAGPGIPENRMASVFEPFVRLEASRNRNSGGVGLGLTIAREIARDHGGDLSLRNGRDGGLVARLTLSRDGARG